MISDFRVSLELDILASAALKRFSLLLLTEFVLDRLYNIDLYIARTQKVSRASFESLRVQFLNEKKFAFRCFVYAIRGIRNLSNLTESIKQKLQKLTINSNIYVLCQIERRKKFINYSLHLNLSRTRFEFIYYIILTTHLRRSKANRSK